MAVSKGLPVERLRAAVDAGFDTLGENRVQEAAPKVAALPGVEWHLVGHLQGNKAVRARAIFQVIQSVDSLELARRLDRLASEAGPLTAETPAQPSPVYLQVNVDADPTKAGFETQRLEAATDELTRLSGLQLCGLMTVGRLVRRPEDARPTFRRLAELSERLRTRLPALGAGLSMGMSDDFEVAVEEGASLVRLGRAVFGQR